MRKQKVKFFRRLVARNYAGIDDCCGIDSLRQLCDSCIVRRSMLYSGLDWLADTFRLNWESTCFALLTYNETDVGGVHFEMESKMTKEIVIVELSPRAMNIGKDWQREVAESATQSDSKK